MVDAHKLFLCKMTKIVFHQCPTDEAMRALPDVDSPTNETGKNLLFS